MTCEHCCGADELFDEKSAEKRLRHYIKKGPRKTSRKLIEGIGDWCNGSISLLDIGGGIGAVHLEMIKKGISEVTNVDASSGSIAIAQKEAKRQNAEDKVTYLHGDFMDHAESIDKHDIVILDKVICCYPHMKELLQKSLDKTSDVIGLVYPKSNILGKSIIDFGNLLFWIKRSSFRVYLHKNSDVRALIASNGLSLVHTKTVYPWNIEIYKRSS